MVFEVFFELLNVVSCCCCLVYNKRSLRVHNVHNDALALALACHVNLEP